MFDDRICARVVLESELPGVAADGGKATDLWLAFGLRESSSAAALAELKAGGAVALATHACSNEVASLGYVDKYEAKVKILRLPTAF